MRKNVLLFLMLFVVTNTMWANISVQTKIFDADSQPPIVGGVISEFFDGSIMKRGVIVSSTIDDAVYKDDENWDDISWYFDIKDYRIIDCTDVGNIQFWCSLKLLKSDCDYYVRAFVIMNDETVYLGNVEKLHSMTYNRNNCSSDYANVWNAFDHILFDLTSDEIINPNDGFYYSTNENPTRVSHQVGTGYNTCYKFATEWNYKLWYHHNINHCDKNKVVSLPIMTYSNGKLTIEKNPQDADKNITIYYSINGNYFRPETYTDVYNAPIEITEPCTVYCYAISSEGYISYTNMYVVENIKNEISVQTKIFDANSQPMLVGGFIENYSKQNVSKKGVIVSRHDDDLEVKEDAEFINAEVLLIEKDGYTIDKPFDLRFIDCTGINEEQFACALQFLLGNTDYYVKAFVIDKDDNVFYGSTEKVHTQDFNRYDGWAGYGNVWYAFNYTLFDLTTDEIIDPNNGFYYSTNENPKTVRHQVGTSYNTCYKFLTEWNYKLWYSQRFGWDGSPKKEGKSVHIPTMKFTNGLLTIEKNPQDADKDITIYYSINGNYFRPETYTDVYTAPIEITEPCAVYCYAISSEGYISYTNMYIVENVARDISVQTKIFDKNSQPMLVGGFVENFSKENISKKGIIISKNADDMIITDDIEFDNATIFLQGKTTGRINNPHDIRFIDCTETNEEQFACALQFLVGNTDYYVKAFVIDKDNNVFYGSTEKVHTQDFNRYNGWADYANVYYYSSHTLFDVVTDEIIEKDKGYYSTTNESPTTVRYRTGSGAVYKLATEWNYKLWYSQVYHGTLENNSSEVVSLPVMRYTGRLLTIEKNPLDADKDITIYYSINGNYFRPETYTDVYTTPIEITEPCAVYCYAISSEGYISYTNMYVIGDYTIGNEDDNNSDFGKIADVVDLGLSVKWASWNVGASKVADYGVLYGAGDPTGLLTSTNYGDYYWKDGESICGTEYDLAKAKWGDEWRLPTTDEIRELKEKCSWESNVTIDGVVGSVVTGPNGNTIFIPYAGHRIGTTNYRKGEHGSIWTGDMGVGLHSYGYMDMDVNSDGTFQFDGCENYFGQSVRPVFVETTNDTFGTVADVVDLGLSVKWSSWNMGASCVGDYGGLYGAGDPTGLKTSTSYDDYYWKDGESICGTEYDLAHVKWGGNWRMPSWKELEELQTKCEWSNGEVDGVKGSWIKGPNGNSIFLPWSGNRKGVSTFTGEGTIGYYWSGDMGVRLHSNGYQDLDIDKTGVCQTDGAECYWGQSIRPVYTEHVKDMCGTVPDIIDLGLSSGTLWASWNLGASSPEEYGDYFAWGETVPKNNYDWSTYKFGSGYDFTKYNSIDLLTELELEDDAANVILGTGWRMPTHKEELELVNECSWEPLILNGVLGYEVTGPNGNSIFLPKGGLYDGTDYDCDGTSISHVNTSGWYWSSTLNSAGSAYAQGHCFFPSLLTNVIDHERCDGHNIRPVYIRKLKLTEDNGGVDYGNDDNDYTDLNGNVIDNIYYNISEENGEYNSTEGCIILKKSTSDADMSNLEGQDIFGEDFKNGFTGIVFKVHAGSGTIIVNAETTGGMILKVKIGNNTPITMELDGKIKASFPYTVNEPTYVYIYGGNISYANARGMHNVLDNSNTLKIYGIEWSSEITKIDNSSNVLEKRTVIYNMNGHRVETPDKGIYIKNRKKIIVKKY